MQLRRLMGIMGDGGGPEGVESISSALQLCPVALLDHLRAHRRGVHPPAAQRLLQFTPSCAMCQWCFPSVPCVVQSADRTGSAGSTGALL